MKPAFNIFEVMAQADQHQDTSSSCVINTGFYPE